MLELRSEQLGIREQIMHLIDVFKFDLNIISKVSGVELSLLKKFVDGQTDLIGLALSIDQLSKFTGTISMLYSEITAVDDDSRVKSIIDYLTSDLGISLQTIAIYSEVQLSDLESFMKGDDLVSYEKRYRIATKGLFLYFLFK